MDSKELKRPCWASALQIVEHENKGTITATIYGHPPEETSSAHALQVLAGETQLLQNSNSIRPRLPAPLLQDPKQLLQIIVVLLNIANNIHLVEEHQRIQRGKRSVVHMAC